MAPVKPVLAVKSTLSGPAAKKQHRCRSESNNQPQHNDPSIVEVSCKGVYEIQLSDPFQEGSACLPGLPQPPPRPIDAAEYCIN